jgi:hypothetical protein
LKLFSNYFFNHWKEQDRDTLRLNNCGPVVNTEQLYWKYDGQGHVEERMAQSQNPCVNEMENGLLSAIDDRSSDMFDEARPSTTTNTYQQKQ